jgi:hypothetical protein
VSARVQVSGPLVALILVAGVTSACSSPPPVAVFHTPPGPSRAIPVAEDVPVLAARLHVLGDTRASVVVQGDTVVVGGGGRLPASASFFVQPGGLYLRPVLCGAPAYVPSTTPAPSGHLPTCGPQYQTSATDLAVTPDNNSIGGYTATNIPPDPTFSAYPSTKPSADEPSRTVLLPGDPNAGVYPRYVLGPAQMDGSPRSGSSLAGSTHRGHASGTRRRRRTSTDTSPSTSMVSCSRLRLSNPANPCLVRFPACSRLLAT